MKRIIGCVDLVVLLVLGIFLICSAVSRKNLPLSLQRVDSWEAYDNCLMPEPVALEKGTYELLLHYETGSDQEVYFTLYQDNLLSDSKYYLDHFSGEQRLAFEVKKAIPDFQFFVNYNGEGTLEIKDATICKTMEGTLRVVPVVLLILLLLTVGAWILTSDKKAELLQLLGITVLMSLPLFSAGLSEGHDIGFHLVRIEAIADGIRGGQFPVRMPSLWMSGYGYASAIMYPDFFLYFPALLRLCGVSVVGAYKWYAFMINALTVGISYVSFSKIFASSKRGMLLTLLYGGSIYRFVNLYYREAVGEYTAMAFLPLLALGLYLVYTEPAFSIRSSLRNAVILSIAATGIMESHVLSVEMTLLVMVIFLLVMAKKTFRKQVLVSGVMAGGITLALNAGFLVPFLDYYKNVPLAVTDFSGEVTKINSLGVYLPQLFAIPFKLGGGAIDVVEKRLASVPGPVLMLVLLCAIYLLMSGRCRNRNLMLYLGFSLLCLWMSTNLFPWDQLGAIHPKIGGILSSIQFPWRYMALATLFLTLLCGEVIRYFAVNVGEKVETEKTEEKIATGESDTIKIEVRKLQGYLMVAAVVSMLWCCGLYQKEAQTKFYEGGAADLYSFDPMGGEYLPRGTTWMDVEGLTREYSLENIVASDIRQMGATKQIHVVTGAQGGLVAFPAFSYKGYHVIDDRGQEYPIVNGAINRMCVHVPEAYEGTLTLSFIQPWYYRAADIVSLLAGLIVLAIYIIAVRPAFREEHLH